MQKDNNATAHQNLSTTLLEEFPPLEQRGANTLVAPPVGVVDRGRRLTIVLEVGFLFAEGLTNSTVAIGTSKDQAERDTRRFRMSREPDSGTDSDSARQLLLTSSVGFTN